jgi:anti-anti-sigma regulatory factor
LRLCLMHFKMFGKEHFFISNVSDDIYQVFHISGLIEMMNVTRTNTTSEVA